MFTNNLLNNFLRGTKFNYFLQCACVIIIVYIIADNIRILLHNHPDTILYVVGDGYIEVIKSCCHITLSLCNGNIESINITRNYHKQDLPPMFFFTVYLFFYFDKTNSLKFLLNNFWNLTFIIGIVVYLYIKLEKLSLVNIIVLMWDTWTFFSIWPVNIGCLVVIILYNLYNIFRVIKYIINNWDDVKPYLKLYCQSLLIVELCIYLVCKYYVEGFEYVVNEWILYYYMCKGALAYTILLAICMIITYIFINRFVYIDIIFSFLSMWIVILLIAAAFISSFALLHIVCGVSMHILLHGWQLIALEFVFYLIISGIFSICLCLFILYSLFNPNYYED